MRRGSVTWARIPPSHEDDQTSSTGDAGELKAGLLEKQSEVGKVPLLSPTAVDK